MVICSEYTLPINIFASAFAAKALTRLTLPMDEQKMHANWLCVVVSDIDVRGLGVWVRCGAGARG